jgi:hypothetical protein
LVDLDGNAPTTFDCQPNVILFHHRPLTDII